MIIVNTGEGKGKTTAALGAALRAVGEGKRVLMIQFIKGPWKSGEDDSARFIPEFELRKMGKGFVGILGDSIPRSEHKDAAQAAFEMAKTESSSGDWDMLILDEINNALHLELLDLNAVLEFLKAFPKDRHLILTGRDAHEEIMKYADLITEMRDVKHPYHGGVKGKRGIEY